jgi:hypothetical protein
MFCLILLVLFFVLICGLFNHVKLRLVPMEDEQFSFDLKFKLSGYYHMNNEISSIKLLREFYECNCLYFGIKCS